MSAPVNPEVEVQHEPLTEDLFYAMLSGVGNHEAKLAAAAITAASPDYYFSESMMHKEMMSRQGTEPAWDLHASHTSRYFEQSIGPIGFLVKGTVDGRRGPIDAYRATDLGVSPGLAFEGALMEWSLLYPDLSLQKVFGSTSSNGAVRSPEVRYEITRQLLAIDPTGASYPEIATAIGDKIGKRIIEQQVRNMERIGLVQVTSIMDEHNPGFDIIGTEFSSRSLDFESLQPETQLFYRVIQAMEKEGVTTGTLHDFLNTCSRVDPEADLASMRRLFVAGTNSNTTNFLPIVKLHEPLRPKSQRTVTTLEPDHIEPLRDLFSRLDDIRSGRGLDEYSRTARTIIDDPELFNQLIAKAKRFSANSIAMAEGTEGLDNKVREAITVLGSLSVVELMIAVETLGRKIHKNSMHESLARLMAKGVLHKELVAPDVSKRNKVSVFSLKADDQDQ